jgi:hypothetical protein
MSVVSRSIVTCAHSAAARFAGSTASAAAATFPSPVSTAAHCAGLNLRASPAAVVAARPGTGASSCPAVSARWRSSPTQKSSPASCAAATPTSSCPPVSPRRRCLSGLIAASNRPITSSRSASSVTASIPDTGVNVRSGAPIRTRRRPRRQPRTLPTR